MTPLTATLVWGVLQVTLFSIAAGAIYLAVRRLAAGAAGVLLTGSLALVLVLTLLAASPWPRWRLAADAAPAVSIPDQAATAGTAPSASPERERAAPPTPSPYAAAWDAFTEALAAPVQEPSADRATDGWDVVAIVRWVLAGCLLVSIARLAWGVWQVHRLLARSRLVEDPRPAAILAALQEKIALAGPISLRESADLATPATVGWRRRHILLPTAWGGWSDDELRAALAHELSHVAAGDYRSWLVARLAVAVHFYHPVVRWLAGRLQLEQELAADASAARLVGDRRAYLECLASLALATPNHRLAGPARTLIPSRSLLMRRVEMLRAATNRGSRFGSGRGWRGGMVGLMALVALAIAGVRQPATSSAEEPALAPNTFVALNAPGRIPLSVVPADTIYAISIRPAELLQDEAYDPLMKEIDEFTTLKDSELSARDIVELMLIISGREKSQSRMVMRCKSPESLLTLTSQLLKLNPEKRLKVSDNTKVFQRPSGRITRLDDVTIVVEPHSKETPNGEGLPPLHSAVSQKWEAEWSKHDDRQLVGAVSLAALRQLIPRNEEGEALGELPGGFPMRVFAPVIEHTDWAVAGVGLDEQLVIDALAQCDSDQHATQVSNIVQALITLGGVAVAQQSGEAVRQMDRLPQEEQDKFRPALVRLLAIATDFTANAKPAAEGDRVTLAYATDEVNAGSAAVTTTMLLPAAKAARAAARRTQSTNDLRNLALAMLTYEDANGSLPPPVLHKDDSPHPYSWRVALLPYLDQQALYDAYNFDEPWDSEANKWIAETVVPVFQSPFDDPASTNASYFVLTGPDTVFSGKEGARFVDIRDGSSKTLLIVEAKRSIPWTKPEDLPYAADKPAPTLGGWMPNLFLAANCDGSVMTHPQSLSPEVLRAWITKSGGERTRQQDGKWVLEAAP